ncbi:MAG: hypothetical protein AAF698_03230 [Pseudomonadota bacterium]
MAPPRIGIICGMESERIALGGAADHPSILTAISAARPAQAEAEAARLAGAGCTLLVSWGLAGGLAPGLTPGDLIVPRTVVSEAGEEWAAAPCPSPLEALARAQPERLLGVEHVVLDPVDKAKLAAASGAAAVDMESHRVARAAAAAGVAFLVVRALGDPATRALPALAADAIGPDGRPKILRVVLGLIARPTDLPALLRTKRDSDAGHAALQGAAAAIASITA